MPIFKIGNKTVLFIHIPKTGGTTIGNWLMKKGEVSFLSPNRPPAFGCCPQHFTHSDFMFLFKRKSWDYAFTIVRDPYERMESEYFFFADPLAGKFGIAPDFSVWMLEQLTICGRNPLHRDNHVRCQLDFVDEGMDIFKYENGLESIAEHISRAIGLGNDFSNQRINAGNRRPLSWTAQALESFNQFYQADFVKFGYELKSKKLEIISNTNSP